MKVRAPDACWPWAGNVLPERAGGYGSYSWAYRTTERAHRLAWRLTHGDIPEGMQVHHTCEGSPLCCNPRHLQLLTPQAHGREGARQHFGIIGDEKTCRHGHKGERYRKPSTGKIHCHACDRLRAREYKRRTRAAID